MPFPFHSLVALLFGAALLAAAAGLTLLTPLGGQWALWWAARDWAPATCSVQRGAAGELLLRAQGDGGERWRQAVAIEADTAAAPAPGQALPCWLEPAPGARATLQRDWPGWWWLPGAWALALLLNWRAGAALGDLWRWAWDWPRGAAAWRQWRASFTQRRAWPAVGGGLAVVLAGLGATWALGVQPWWHWWQAQAWPERQCTIVEGPVLWHGASRFGGRGGWFMHMAFAHPQGGQRHVVQGYAPWALGRTQWRLQAPPREVVDGRVVELTPHLRLGSTHACWVNPHNPAQGYLDRSLWPGGYVFAALGPVLALFGLLLIAARPRPTAAPG